VKIYRTRVGPYLPSLELCTWMADLTAQSTYSSIGTPDPVWKRRRTRKSVLRGMNYVRKSEAADLLTGKGGSHRT